MQLLINNIIYIKLCSSLSKKKCSAHHLNEVNKYTNNPKVNNQHSSFHIKDSIWRVYKSLQLYSTYVKLNVICNIKQTFKKELLVSILLIDPKKIEKKTWTEVTIDSLNAVGNFAYENKGIIFTGSVLVIIILLVLKSGQSPDAGSGRNLTHNTDLPDIGGLGGSDLTYQAVEVILQPEAPRALYSIVAGAAGLVVTWTLGFGWSEVSAPLVPLTLEELDSLQVLAESIMDLNPTALLDIQNNPKAGLKALGELSGILSVDSPQSSKKVINLLLPLLATEDVTFEGIKNTTLSLGQQQNRHRLLMMYELLSLMLQIHREKE